ncbi:MAG: 8-oxoguanine DNA glycosylase [Lachnospiraceae bacterium]|nr:8-oxoguanine DNA glycosylase [Lachnospiraceae bacterium]
MITKKIDHLNLEQIAESGQCFRWEKTKDGYEIPAFGKVLNCVQEGDVFTFDCTESEWQNLWENYFDIGFDYADVERRIRESKDEHLILSFNEGSGIRILNQDLWEIIVSFVISQNNNIPRIRKSIEKICEKANPDTKVFPRADDLPQDFFDDTSLGLGYRDVYLRELVSYVKENPGWIESLKKMNYDEAFESLVKRKGIGKKVANCICLFGLHHVDAFPVDTHVKQLLDKYYSNGFDFERFDGIAGIIQQYLFYFEIAR